MCVVSRGCGGLHGGMDGGGGWYACGRKPWGLVACREMPAHFLITKSYQDDTRSHRRLGAKLWIGLSLNWSVFLERPGC